MMAPRTGVKMGSPAAYEWRGQAQYQAFIKSVSDPAAHAVTNLTIAIDPQGKVVGASAENGCRMLGIAAPGITSTIVKLDVTLRDCRYAVCVR